MINAIKKSSNITFERPGRPYSVRARAFQKTLKAMHPCMRTLSKTRSKRIEVKALFVERLQYANHTLKQDSIANTRLMDMAQLRVADVE